jgi:flagellar motility protein MotE (MotC chaperone)
MTKTKRHPIYDQIKQLKEKLNKAEQERLKHKLNLSQELKPINNQEENGS